MGLDDAVLDLEISTCALLLFYKRIILGKTCCDDIRKNIKRKRKVLIC